MKLLITGGNGFIGRHAVIAALARGWEVDPLGWAATNLSLVSRIKADVVLHLAAFASNAGFAAHLAENYDNNVGSTWKMLRLAQQFGARVVYASSSAVYGKVCSDAEACCTEDFPHWDFTSHYAKSKLINEMMAESFAETGLSTLGLRIFNAYGPGDERKRHPSPISQMIAAKRAGTKWICYSDGTQAKDFIHVSDVVEITMRLIEAEATGIVNVGTGVATSFNDLARLIGCEMQYAPVPDPVSYQFFTRASTERLESIIGRYECKSVEEGIKNVL